MKRKMCILLAAIIAIVLFGACVRCNTPEQETVQLRVTPETIQIAMGETKQLSITVTPKDVTYTCTSSDESVAKVDNKGLVTGVKSGEAFIKVEAKDQSKSIKVIVSSRYIGLNSSNKKIAPIYIPFFPELVTSKESHARLIAANEKYGWVLKSHDEDDDHDDEGGEHDHKMITMQAPKDQNGHYTDDRLIGDLYYHYKNKDDVYFDCWTKPLFNKDVVKAAHEGSKDDLKLLEDILRLYGFTEYMQLSKYKSGQLNFEGYNTKQFPEGAMWGSIYCTNIPGTGTYYLEVQVVQREPKK